MGDAVVMPQIIGPDDDYTGRWRSAINPTVTLLVQRKPSRKKGAARRMYVVRFHDGPRNVWTVDVSPNILPIWVAGWKLERVP